MRVFWGAFGARAPRGDQGAPTKKGGEKRKEKKERNKKGKKEKGKKKKGRKKIIRGGGGGKGERGDKLRPYSGVGAKWQS